MKPCFVLAAIVFAIPAHAAPKAKAPKAQMAKARYIGTWSEAASASASGSLMAVLVLTPDNRYRYGRSNGGLEEIYSARSPDITAGRWEIKNGVVLLTRDRKASHLSSARRGYARLSRDGKTMKVSFIYAMEVPVQRGKKRTFRTARFPVSRILRKGAPNPFTLPPDKKASAKEYGRIRPYSFLCRLLRRKSRFPNLRLRGRATCARTRRLGRFLL